jgi:hypothetical protein
MSTVQTVPRGALPPPARASTLLDETGIIGGTDANRLTFTGFASINEAAAAAWIARAALERRAAKSRREAAPYFEREPLQLVTSDDGEWIQAEETRLARLIRPPEPSAWFGIEVVLPANASQLTIDSSAHVVYRALRRSGARWPIRDVAVVPTDAAGKASTEPADAELIAANAHEGKGGRVHMPEQPDRSNIRSPESERDEVESASLDSFPASDPPKWSSLRLGPPDNSEWPPETESLGEVTTGSRESRAAHLPVGAG